MSKFDENIMIEECEEHHNWIEQRRHENWLKMTEAYSDIKSDVALRVIEKRNSRLNIADHFSGVMEMIGFVLATIPAIMFSIILLNYLADKIK